MRGLSCYSSSGYLNRVVLIVVVSMLVLLSLLINLALTSQIQIVIQESAEGLTGH
jgi:hypothetical protein